MSIKRGFLAWLRGDSEPETADDAAAEQEDATVEPHQPEGALTDRYRDLGEIGRGAMARVRRAYDRNLLRTVAVKLLDPQIAAIKGELDRFIEEAQITGQLEHPNIPAIHELGADDEGTHFFTMRYVRGQNLEQILKQGFSVRSERQLFTALQTFVKVCEAVSFAHSRGVLHCDLKPANIMVGKHGQVYVMDWGIARLRATPRPSGADSQAHAVALRRAEKERSDEGKIVGSLGYMSPEQAQGKNKNLDERSDVFSLGAVLYRALVGRPPYLAQTEDELIDLAASAGWTAPQQAVAADMRLPPQLCAVVEKAMAKLPEDRYQSVEDLQEEVERYLAGSGRTPARTVQPGQAIVREGEPGSSAYVIEKGRCVAYKMVDGRRQVLREMGPGDIFGEMAILTSAPRTATVEALEEVTVRVLTADALAQELGQTFFMGRLLKVLAERFHDVDARNTELTRELTMRTLREAALAHLALGRREGDRAVAAWQPLVAEIGKRYGRCEEEALQAARAIPGVAVDPEGNEISCQAPSESEADTLYDGLLSGDGGGV
jgi:serine/threonine-protein kinase